MIRRLAAAGPILLFLATIASADQARQVIASALNVRSGPGMSYPILGIAEGGQKYVVLSTSGSWVQIWWSGNSAWVYGGYTKVATGTGAKVAVASLGMRSVPSFSNSIVGMAGADEVYFQIAMVGGWKKVWFGGAARWCYGAYTSAVSLSGTSIAPPPPSSSVGWQSSYVGLNRNGSSIPRAGLANGTLHKTLGIKIEPYGNEVSYQGYAFVLGKVSWFGGPNDSGTAGETVALTGESAYSLNNPTNPSASYLAAHPEKYYYAAMRWNYSPNGSSWWASQRILVINPATGKAVVVRPVDWGPNTYTGRILDLSPRAISDLGLITDQQAIVAFVNPNTTLGVK